MPNELTPADRTMQQAVEESKFWLKSFSIRHPKKRAFLSIYSLVGNISRASKLVGISRDTHQEWKHTDPEYARAFDEAHNRSIDVLEAEAMRRAVQGVQKPVYHQGEQVGAITDYSDVLLIFLMKGARPEKYRDNYHVTSEHTERREARLELVINLGDDARREIYNRLLESPIEPLRPSNGEGVPGGDGNGSHGP